MNSPEATKRLAQLKELQVKGRSCLVIDPQKQQVRLRLHWLLHGVADDDVRTELAAFGKVTEVTREPTLDESTDDLAKDASSHFSEKAMPSAKQGGVSWDACLDFGLDSAAVDATVYQSVPLECLALLLKGRVASLATPALSAVRSAAKGVACP
ncbi:hypothetical protein HPB50_025518 [Hyalomma asiaticum]|uniref:Uncharacterized protein n=1 Tax=Hyalomma asiaticum TaxID=266040 RepID=A0ACB7SPF6_HYAAI|nr:hypothetical protein HPB50_025518 [Hyalomma asiaticum]